MDIGSVANWTAIGISLCSAAVSVYSYHRTKRLEDSLAKIGPIMPDELRRAFMKLQSSAEILRTFLQDAASGNAIADPAATLPKLLNSLTEANTALFSRMDEIQDVQLKQYIAGACRFVILRNHLDEVLNPSDIDGIVESCHGGLARLDQLQGR